MTNKPIDFLAYAQRRDRQQHEQNDQQEAVNRAWSDALAARGASFADPVAAAAALGVADMLDRMVGGALMIRVGGPDRAPDPGNGLDPVGAQLVRNLLADLRGAVEAAQKPAEE